MNSLSNKVQIRGGLSRARSGFYDELSIRTNKNDRQEQAQQSLETEGQGGYLIERVGAETEESIRNVKYEKSGELPSPTRTTNTETIK